MVLRQFLKTNLFIPREQKSVRRRKTTKNRPTWILSKNNFFKVLRIRVATTTKHTNSIQTALMTFLKIPFLSPILFNFNQMSIPFYQDFNSISLPRLNSFHRNFDSISLPTLISVHQDFDSIPPRFRFHSTHRFDSISLLNSFQFTKISIPFHPDFGSIPLIDLIPFH